MTQTMKAPAQTAVPQYLITDADRDRMKAIHDAWKAYHGDLDKPLKPMPGQADDNVMSNRMMPVVNTGVFFLFGKELEISVEEGGPQEAQDFLNDAWGRKEARIPLLQKLAMNGAMSGHAFLRIVPNADKSEFRLIAVDPSTVYMQTAPQDVDTVMLFCIQYACTEMVNGQPKQVWYREEITRIDPDGDSLKGLPDDDDTWTMQHWTFTGQHGIMPKQQDWKVAGPAIVWPYSFPPIFHCQNMPYPNEVWGMPDLTTDLIGLNDALNFVQSNIGRINKLYGNPWPYATGVEASQLSVEPGRITTLPEGATMGAVQFVSDVPSALTFAANIRSDIDEQSNVPSVATGRIETLPRGNMSGIALELLFMPLLKKTETKQCSYGKLIIDVSKALLVLNGFTDDIDITLEWQSPIPHDDLQSGQYALTLLQAGVSKTTVQRMLGFDPEEEQALNQEEDQAALLAFSRGQGMPPALPAPPGMAPQAPMPGQQQQPGANPFLGGH